MKRGKFGMQGAKCGIQTKAHTRSVTAIGILVMILYAGAATAGNLLPIGPVPVPAGNPQTPGKIELGKKLFFDRRLSGDGTMSCSTCHDPAQGYSDGLAISLSYPTTRNWRNSPTLINVGFQKYLFQDGRAHTLEEQAIFPMMSAFEMNQNLDFVEEEIRSVPEYVVEFRKVFEGEVTRERIAMALASFQRSLVSLNAPLDRFLKGDRTALSPDARKGYEIFMGKGRCVECHDGIDLADDRFHALNVPENIEQEKDPRVAATRRFVARVSHYEDYRNLTEDPGRYLVTGDKKDWKAFRTPTLREIARTGPYMHNGIFETLDQVIEFLDRGGGTGNSALKPLQLSPAEKKALKAFLTEALSGEEILFKYPKLP